MIDFILEICMLDLIVKVINKKLVHKSKVLMNYLMCIIRIGPFVFIPYTLRYDEWILPTH